MNIKSLLPFLGRKAAADAKLAEVNELRKQLCTPTVDPKLMRRELLEAQDVQGRTVIHETTVAGGLHRIPKDMLTKELLHIKDLRGNTVLHMAARGSYLNQIPERFLDIKDLLAKNGAGESPLQLAVKNDCFDDIPKTISIPMQGNNPGSYDLPVTLRKIVEQLQETKVNTPEITKAISQFSKAIPPAQEIS